MKRASVSISYSFGKPYSFNHGPLLPFSHFPISAGILLLSIVHAYSRTYMHAVKREYSVALLLLLCFP